MRLPRFLWRLMHFAKVPYTKNPKAPIGGVVLLLTTTGRKSGQPRVTPLQYEEENGVIYIGSARGTQADWFKNIVACPQVRVQIRTESFDAIAEPITDAQRIADFMELRLKQHPRMVGLMMQLEGLPSRPSRAQLEQYASKIAMVALRRVPAVPAKIIPQSEKAP